MLQTPSNRYSSTPITQTRPTNRLFVPADRIPILSITEIAECLSIFNINATEQELSRPTPETMVFLYRHILDDVFMVGKDKVQDVVNKVLENNRERDEERGNEEGDNDDSMGILVLNRLLQRHLTRCGIEDFSLSDLIRPDIQRTRRNLSAVINYTRFHMEHVEDNLAFVNENDEVVLKLRQIQQSNSKTEEELKRLQMKIQMSQGKMDRIHAELAQLETQFKERRKLQEQISKEHETYKVSKATILKELEDDTYLMENKEVELNKWKSKYKLDSPEKLKRLLAGLHTRLSEELSQNTQISNKVTKLSISTNTFTDLCSQLSTYQGQLEAITTDITKHQTATRKLTQLQHDLNTKQLKLTEKQHQIQLSQRAIKSLEDRHQRLDEQYERRKAEFTEKNKLLDVEYIKTRNQAVEMETQLKGMELYVLRRREEIQKIRERSEHAQLEIEKLVMELDLQVRGYVGMLSEKVAI